MAERARIASNLPVRHCPRHLLRAERCRRRESSTEIHWLVEMLHKVPASPGPGDRSSACFCFWLASWYTTRLPVGWSECVPPRHAMTGELESFYPACLLTAKLNCPDFAAPVENARGDIAGCYQLFLLLFGLAKPVHRRSRRVAMSVALGVPLGGLASPQITMTVCRDGNFHLRLFSATCKIREK